MCWAGAKHPSFNFHWVRLGQLRKREFSLCSSFFFFFFALSCIPFLLYFNFWEFLKFQFRRIPLFFPSHNSKTRHTETYVQSFQECFVHFIFLTQCTDTLEYGGGKDMKGLKTVPNCLCMVFLTKFRIFLIN